MKIFFSANEMKIWRPSFHSPSIHHHQLEGVSAAQCLCSLNFICNYSMKKIRIHHTYLFHWWHRSFDLQCDICGFVWILINAWHRNLGTLFTSIKSPRVHGERHASPFRDVLQIVTFSSVGWKGNFNLMVA